MQLTDLEYKQFWSEVSRKLLIKSDLRTGQVMYNTLYNIQPLVAESIGGTENDPFFRDDRIGAFIKAIRPK